MDQVSKQLIEMGKLDQKAHSDKIDREKIKKIDEKNTKSLKRIVADIGLPTISKVGEEAYKSAWLIAQHTQDIDFKKKYLELMKESIDDVKKQDIAYLTDRVLVIQGKPQIYGTQLVYNKDVDSYELHKVKDSRNLTKRRTEVGLGSIEDYKERFKSE